MVFAVLCSPAFAGNIVDISLVTVGDPGNVADPDTGYGAVPYVYQMGEYDVTTADYAAFLNSVATTGDPYGLYSSKMATDLPTAGITQKSTSAGYVYNVKGNGNVPVFDTSWGDAARFVNWLANGQPTGPEGRHNRDRYVRHQRRDHERTTDGRDAEQPGYMGPAHG